MLHNHQQYCARRVIKIEVTKEERQRNDKEAQDKKILKPGALSQFSAS